MLFNLNSVQNEERSNKVQKYLVRKELEDIFLKDNNEKYYKVIK